MELKYRYDLIIELEARIFTLILLVYTPSLMVLFGWKTMQGGVVSWLIVCTS